MRPGRAGREMGRKVTWVSARSCDLFKDSCLLWKRVLMSQWVLGAGPASSGLLQEGWGSDTHPSVCSMSAGMGRPRLAALSFLVLRAHCVPTLGTQSQLPVCEKRTWDPPHCDRRSLQLRGASGCQSRQTELALSSAQPTLGPQPRAILLCPFTPSVSVSAISSIRTLPPPAPRFPAPSAPVWGCPVDTLDSWHFCPDHQGRWPLLICGSTREHDAATGMSLCVWARTPASWEGLGKMK